MIWDDTGFLLSKNKYNENSSIVEFFTENHGKVSGLIFGSTSKKIKSYLLIGNMFQLQFNSKGDNRPGYFKIEIEKITTPLFLDNNLKLNCIIYSMNILKLLTAENQENKNLYYLIKILFDNMNFKNWLKKYIFWELEVLKILGYNIDFKNYAQAEKINGNVKYFVNSNNNKRLIPNFLINKSSEPKNNIELQASLKLVGDFLEKTILKPNNLYMPSSRLEFTKLIK